MVVSSKETVNQNPVAVGDRTNPQRYVNFIEFYAFFKERVLKTLRFSLYKGAVMAVAATIAATTTYAFGWSCNFYYKNGMSIDLRELGLFYQQTYDEYKK